MSPSDTRPRDKTSFIGSEEAARLELARSHFQATEGLVRSVGQALRISADHLEAERVGMWLLDPTQLRCLTVYTRSTWSLSEAPPIERDSCPNYFEAVQKRRSIVADDAVKHRYTRDLAAGYLIPNGIGALIDAPVYRSGRVFGVVCHEHKGGPRAWTEAEVNFASGVADIVSTLLEQAEMLVLQQRLRKAEADASLAHLGREVAHDFAQYLQIIGLAASIDPAKASPARITQAMTDIRAASTRASGLVRALMGFGRALALEPTPLSVDEAILGSMPVLQGLLNKGGDLSVDARSHAVALVDATVLERILINLVTNARDAMPGGGRIHIATSTQVPAGKMRPHVRIAVSDEGQGIPEAIRGRIFEPYFSTKAGTQGTGLGLAFVCGAVEQQGGFVEVESGAAGATLSAWFPVADT